LNDVRSWILAGVAPEDYDIDGLGFYGGTANNMARLPVVDSY